MSWKDKFIKWIEQGKSLSWLTTRVNWLFDEGYINEEEKAEIMAVLPSA